MGNEHAKSDMAEILGEVEAQMRVIAGIQRSRSALVGTGSVRRNRVTVSVNADGTVIETKFGQGIEDLTHSEIAKAVTEAAQKAAGHLAEQHAALMAPLQERRARMPKLSDLVEGMPDLRLAEPPQPSLAPPDSLDRAVSAGTEEPRYNDVEQLPGPSKGRVTDSGW